MQVGRIDPAPVLAALQAMETPFADGDWRRTLRYTPHPDSDTIEIVGPPSHGPRDVLDSLTLMRRLDVAAFDALLAEIAGIACRPTARAMIVSLRPGGWVRPHVDSGRYADATERFHLVLETNPDCWLGCGESKTHSATRVHAAAGELWLLDKHRMHDAYNFGTTPRLHVIVDAWRP